MPYAKICRYRAEHDDLLVQAGCGWNEGVIGYVVSPADETSTQGRAFVTGEPVILEDLSKNNTYALPPFYGDHEIVATADVLIKGKGGPWASSRSTVQWPVRSTNTISISDWLRQCRCRSGGHGGSNNCLTNHHRSDGNLDCGEGSPAHGTAGVIDRKRCPCGRTATPRPQQSPACLGMLRQQIDLNDGGPKEGLRSIAQRVMSLAKIYDHLLGNGLSRTIDFDQYVRSLCESLSAFQGDRKFHVDSHLRGRGRALARPQFRDCARHRHRRDCLERIRPCLPRKRWCDPRSTDAKRYRRRSRDWR